MLNKNLSTHIMNKNMTECLVNVSKPEKHLRFDIIGTIKGELPESKDVKFKRRSTLLTKIDDDTCSITVASIGSLPKNHVVYQQKHIEGLTPDEYRFATREELFAKYQDEIIEYYLKKFNGWIKDVQKTKHSRSKR